MFTMGLAGWLADWLTDCWLSSIVDIIYQLSHHSTHHCARSVRHGYTAKDPFHSHCYNHSIIVLHKPLKQSKTAQHTVTWLLTTQNQRNQTQYILIIYLHNTKPTSRMKSFYLIKFYFIVLCLQWILKE